MSKITAIVMQQKNKKRVNLSLDGKFCCSLEAISVLKHNLQVGQQLELNDLESIQLDSEKNTAFDKAIKYLSIRMRSNKEMREYLQQKGYLDVVVDWCMDKLLQYGYQDDDVFAKLYIQSKANKNGKYKLEFELKQLGVSQDIVDKHLKTVDTKALLCDLMQKKYKGDNKKIVDYCLSRGFVYEDIKQALAEFVAYGD